MRRRNRHFITGLDVGTTKICAIVGEMADDGINILSVLSHPSTGLKKGVVIDIEATANSIRKVIQDTEDQTGISLREVYVGIAGSHIKNFQSFGAIGVKGREVTPEDVERAIDSAKAVYVPLDREVLHVIPTDFVLDGQEGIKDPVGMSGVRLEVKVNIITGAVTSVQNLLKCCERAGLEVLDIVLQPLASAEATLTADEQDMGIALVDIGGGTTDIAVYREGWLRHTAILGIGGHHFTNDISIGLRVPLHEAERVKRMHGSALPPDHHDRTEVEVVAIDGHVRVIPKSYVAEIIQPRAEELLDLVKQEIQSIHGSGVPVLGMVVTGGASLLAGFDRAAEAILSMPVRIGYPIQAHQAFSSKGSAVKFQRSHGIYGLKGEFNDPMYATGIGLVLYGAGDAEPEEKEIFTPDLWTKVMDTMSDWFKRITGGRNANEHKRV
ncbi:MAG: cell division protein FtsA [Thermodesulfovibrionales bacterium]|jgi:cell division protein FtsA